MLLTDELENAYNELNGDVKQLTPRIFAIMWKRFPTEYKGQQTLTEIKQIDNAWKFFCRSHKEFNPNGFRNLILKQDPTGKFKKALNW